jgi:hypothetical protein
VAKTSSDVRIVGCYRKEKLLLLEDRELRISGPKWDEMVRGWRKLHNEELHKLHSSPYIIRMIKSRRVRWAGHALHHNGALFYIRYNYLLFGMKTCIKLKMMPCIN